jgi:predicted DNA-binding transcriptional regulator YafY
MYRSYAAAMRASRLLSLVMLLQARGPATAEELGERLGVSVRTVHRDVAALRESGVPIEGERGPAGGYRLPGGYRTRLTGLTPDEAEALFVAAPATPLGLGGFLAEAQLKLLAALPPQLRERADRAARIFHVDHGRWFGETTPPAGLDLVAAALWRGQRLRVVHRGRERLIDPLGLVMKGPTWYLVALTDDGERTFRVERLEAVEALEEPARRPQGFDLPTWWAQWSRAFEQSLPSVPVRVRVAPEALAELRRLVDVRHLAELPERAEEAPSQMRTPNGRLELEVRFERLDHARVLLSLAAAVEVLEPPELRSRIAADAAALAELYRPALIHPSRG